MKIAASSDWRDTLAFDTPVLVADVLPGEPTRCATCGADSEPRERTELWVVKHRHPKNHAGFVRFYCAEHVPVVVRADPPATARVSARAERRAPVRRAPAVERPVAICPDCFVEIPPTGVCGMCGRPAA